MKFSLHRAILGLLLALALAMLQTPARASVPLAGHVSFVSGTVTAVNSRIEPISGRILQKGDPVYAGDGLATTGGAHLHIRTVDDGLLAMRPDTRARIDLFEYNPDQPAATRIRLVLESGVMRARSGTGAQAARERFRLNTPVAAVGIRGTDFTVSATSQVTRVVVQAGAVVLSPFGADCLADALGPCSGAQARLLSFEQAGQLLELRRGDREPRLLDARPGLTPVSAPANTANTATPTKSPAKAGGESAGTTGAGTPGAGTTGAGTTGAGTAGAGSAGAGTTGAGSASAGSGTSTAVSASGTGGTVSASSTSSSFSAPVTSANATANSSGSTAGSTVSAGSAGSAAPLAYGSDPAVPNAPPPSLTASALPGSAAATLQGPLAGLPTTPVSAPGNLGAAAPSSAGSSAPISTTGSLAAAPPLGASLSASLPPTVPPANSGAVETVAVTTAVLPADRLPTPTQAPLFGQVSSLASEARTIAAVPTPTATPTPTPAPSVPAPAGSGDPTSSSSNAPASGGTPGANSGTPAGSTDPNASTNAGSPSSSTNPANSTSGNAASGSANQAQGGASSATSGVASSSTAGSTASNPQGTPGAASTSTASTAPVASTGTSTGTPVGTTTGSTPPPTATAPPSGSASTVTAGNPSGTSTSTAAGTPPATTAGTPPTTTPSTHNSSVVAATPAPATPSAPTTATNPLAPVNSTVAPTPIVQPLPLPTAVWGRWAAYAGSAPLESTSAFRAANGPLVAVNSAYVLSAANLQNLRMPETGDYAFRLTGAEAFETERGQLVAPATVTDGQLRVNFGAATFSTGLSIQVSTGTLQLGSQGRLTRDGALEGQLIFSRPDVTMNVRGQLSGEAAGSAAYLFDALINGTSRGIIGATSWKR